MSSDNKGVISALHLASKMSDVSCEVRGERLDDRHSGAGGKHLDWAWERGGVIS